MFNFNKQRTDKVLLNEQTGAVDSIISGKDDNQDGKDSGN
jgi:hypothetical protein